MPEKYCHKKVSTMTERTETHVMLCCLAKDTCTTFWSLLLMSQSDWWILILWLHITVRTNTQTQKKTNASFHATWRKDRMFGTMANLPTPPLPPEKFLKKWKMLGKGMKTCIYGSWMFLDHTGPSTRAWTPNYMRGDVWLITRAHEL